VFTLRNTSVLWATALAFVLGERPTRRTLTGVALVFVGAVVLGAAHEPEAQRIGIVTVPRS
jgi:drug/metabolite transporter (DMT)-like permease